MNHLSDIINIAIAILVFAASYLLWVMYRRTQAIPRALTQDEIIDQISYRLNVSRWKAKLILEEEKERIIRDSINSLLEKKLIEPVPGELDKNGDPTYRLTDAGRDIAKNRGDFKPIELKVRLDDLISRHLNKDDEP